jgi:hypothetical protein
MQFGSEEGEKSLSALRRREITHEEMGVDSSLPGGCPGGNKSGLGSELPRLKPFRRLDPAGGAWTG